MPKPQKPKHRNIDWGETFRSIPAYIYRRYISNRLTLTDKLLPGGRLGVGVWVLHYLNFNKAKRVYAVFLSLFLILILGLFTIPAQL